MDGWMGGNGLHRQLIGAPSGHWLHGLNERRGPGTGSAERQTQEATNQNGSRRSMALEVRGQALR